MAALDFKNKAAVMAWLTDQLEDEDAEMLEAVLDGTAAHECGDPDVPIYRPFAVLASYVASSPGAYERVKSAAGSEVVYKDQGSAAKALNDRQAILDRNYCGVPTARAQTFAVTW